MIKVNREDCSPYEASPLWKVIASRVSWERVPSQLVMLVALLSLGCRVDIDVCRSIMPVTGDGTKIVRHADGNALCTCTTEGVAVSAEPVRDGIFGWKRGHLWIDNVEVTEHDFYVRLEEAKAEKRIEATAAATKRFATHVGAAARGILKGMVDSVTK